MHRPPAGSTVVTPGFARVGVLGLGLIGGSLLRALRQTGADAVGFDIDPAVTAAAAASGFATAGSVGDAIRGRELVVLAMPLPQVRDAVRAMAPHLAPQAVVTDVGTLKAPVLAALRNLAPHAHVVGGHPLAGTEESGWAATDPLLFRDAPWALTLEDDTELDAWVRLAELVCDIGAKPVPATAAEQDAAVARVIGLPHVLAEALALVGLDGGELGLSLAAGSYTSGSRVARTRPELVATWCDGNPALVTALDEVLARLGAARDALAAGGSVRPLADAGHQARTDWEHRRMVPVELSADPDELRAHGRHGGWITAVLRESGAPVRLLGMRPARR